MSHPAQSFKPVLNSRQSLFADYQKIIRQQQQLLALVKTHLPTELGSHALHCVLNGRKLVLYTDSASWSSQLRFYQQTILQKLQEKGYRQIQAIQIKLMPQQATKLSRLNIKIPSKENIELLCQQAQQQPNDKLNRALLKLGKTLNRLSSEQEKSLQQPEEE